jgi:hypothetical protein
MNVLKFIIEAIAFLIAIGIEKMTQALITKVKTATAQVIVVHPYVPK